jgi:peptide deformylase
VDAELRQLIADLFETMDVAKGVGLAANQVGVARRVAVVGIEQQRLALVNPVILSAEGRDRQEEGCLSVPEVYGEVERPSGSSWKRWDLTASRFGAKPAACSPGRFSMRSITSTAFSSSIT